MPVQGGDTLWVLTIQHRYGTTVQLCTTQEHALAGLHRWVAEWWEHERERTARRTPPARPADRDAAIRLYFEEVAPDESWALTQETVRA